MWDGTCFCKTSLKTIGLRIQLGHPTGEFCPSPNPTWNNDFIVLDVDGLHSVSMDYCGCAWERKSQVTQLLERRLYPATISSPKTAATFRLLEVLELLQYESKITTFEFFQTISRLTDNTGLSVPKVSRHHRLTWLLYFSLAIIGSISLPIANDSRMALPKAVEAIWARPRPHSTCIADPSRRVCLALSSLPSSRHQPS